jgi:hypothetical protein
MTVNPLSASALPLMSKIIWHQKELNSLALNKVK